MKPTSVCEGLDLEGIVRAHQAELWRYLRFLGCEATLVDDLIQETFLSLLQKPFEDRGPATTAAYLRRVARNHYLMALRRSARTPAFEDLDAADRAWQRFGREDGGETYLEALRDCYSKLKAKAHRALQLRFKEKMPRTEIARTLEMSEDGVKSLMRRSRKLLRECVQRRIS